MARRPRSPLHRWRQGWALAALALTLGAAPPARPVWAFTLQDALQLPYLAPEGAEAHYAAAQALTVRSESQDGRRLLSEGDRLTLEVGAPRDLRVGDRFLALKTAARRLRHPAGDHALLGDVVQQVGVVRVTAVEARRAEAVVERCLDGLEAGDRLVPFQEPARLPLRPRTEAPAPPTLDPVHATIVYLREGRDVIAAGDMLIVDRGAEGGFQVGESLHLVRPRGDGGLTRLGEAVVVRADPRAATCRVVQALGELRPGDLVTR